MFLSSSVAVVAVQDFVRWQIWTSCSAAAETSSCCRANAARRSLQHAVVRPLPWRHLAHATNAAADSLPCFERAEVSAARFPSGRCHDTRHDARDILETDLRDTLRTDVAGSAPSNVRDRTGATVSTHGAAALARPLTASEGLKPHTSSARDPRAAARVPVLLCTIRFT